MKSRLYSVDVVSEVASLSRTAIKRMVESGELVVAKDDGVVQFFDGDCLTVFDGFLEIFNSAWDADQLIKPLKDYTSVELFAGCGGMALGLERAGFKHVLLNEFDKNACLSLRVNRPQWNVVEGDVASVDFTSYRHLVDVVAGGFPCQSFSYAGKQLGFEDVRGTLFYEYARALKEIQPKIFLAENVKGLLTHDSGKTLETIKTVLSEVGYTLVECDIYKAMLYKVPQKRERLILIGLRNDLFEQNGHCFEKPSKFNTILNFEDATTRGILFEDDVPISKGVVYSESKRVVMDQVPEGGNWKDLPHEVQIEYMAGSFEAGGGKTGMARRLHRYMPCLTLTCSPAQKQTERCHPVETRPLQVREYARLQTFPDSWRIEGALTNQYKQIGNAVPVNLAHAIGISIIKVLNKLN